MHSSNTFKHHQSLLWLLVFILMFEWNQLNRIEMCKTTIIYRKVPYAIVKKEMPIVKQIVKEVKVPVFVESIHPNHHHTSMDNDGKPEHYLQHVYHQQQDHNNNIHHRHHLTSVSKHHLAAKLDDNGHHHHHHQSTSF